MKHFLYWPTALALGGFSCIGLAADEAPLVLDDQLVTATRTERRAEQTLASVSVLDRADIERSQAQSVPDLLRRLPGISLASNGGPGKATSLYLRGSESDHVLVLIDGIKAGSVSSGGASLQDLPVALIERIEVVRGPRSSLYGSEAIGGVIQIFTRQALEPGFKPWVYAGAGSQSTYEGSAGASAGNGRGWFALGVSSLDTAGIDAKANGASGHEPDRDGYRNLSGSLRAGYRFDNGLELDGSLLQTDSHNDFDTVNSRRTQGFDAYNDGVQRVIGGRARFAPLEPWRVSLSAGRSEDKSDAYQDGAFYSRFDSRRDTASWQNDLDLAPGHTLTLGYDWQQDELSSSTDYALTSRDNRGTFAQYLGSAGRHDWQLSLRHDDNQQFGSRNTGNLAWGYALTDAVRAFASYGTAFKAPTFNELYYPGYGNPDLDAETSRSVELGVDGRHGWGHWAVNLYRTAIDDLIAYDSALRAPDNIDQARIRGVELQLGSQWRDWVWNANASLLDPESRASGNRGNDLPRRARQLFNLDLDRRLDALSLGASLHAEGRRYDDLANRNRLGGFATLDLRGEYRLNPEWRLQARLSNLFDADYQTTLGYEQPGRAVLFGVRYQAL
ncbi:TonB-dependent receptor [Pseudomonas sp. ATCC 13867]|uniref:TonB-dependent vitamin B12 receptor n=1 Tax=Pseudomonas sp. ATCC 13867 TaxID=1294143 RepID=UPI0002C4E221|nr:TonB-dependent receptor [Pseudomonas sp. ATCC 13867]